MTILKTSKKRTWHVLNKQQKQRCAGNTNWKENYGGKIVKEIGKSSTITPNYSRDYTCSRSDKMKFSESYLVIEHSMLVASEDATCGSVIANPDRMFPSSKGISHSFSCSLLPYLNKT